MDYGMVVLESWSCYIGTNLLIEVFSRKAWFGLWSDSIRKLLTLRTGNYTSLVM